MTTLSICIPTRDNSDICKRTIEGILRENSNEFELIIADASKDKDILADFISERNDQRARHVAVNANNRIEHWNKAIVECVGDWITFISDSDYVDPKIVDFLSQIEPVSEDQNIEAVGWNKIDYDWPEHRNEILSAKIWMNWQAFAVNIDEMRNRFCSFEREGLIPFSIYHGAVKRDLADRIRDRFGGVYFEHPMTSYEFGYKVLMEAHDIAFCERSNSVLSAHSEDLLSEATDPSDMEYKKRQFYNDIKFQNFEDIGADFPFEFEWSPRLFSAITLIWLMKKYGDVFSADGWQKNFVERRVDECNGLFSHKRFIELSNLFRGAIEKWEGGRYAQYFSPNFNPKHFSQKDYKGYFNGCLFMDKNALDAKTPSEFYAAYENFVLPTSAVNAKIIDSTSEKLAAQSA